MKIKFAKHFLLTTIYSENDAEAQKLATYKDRKSTRLNSSHLVISYAVFCLKKKIKRVFVSWRSREISSADVKSAALSSSSSMSASFGSPPPMPRYQWRPYGALTGGSQLPH